MLHFDYSSLSSNLIFQLPRTGDVMKKLIITLSIAMSFAIPSVAFADQAACEAKAVSKDGKPLYGAAKDASIKKCMGDAKPNDCEAKAVSKDGKPLYGAAKAASIKKCEGGK
jgi:hypothetical protein